MKSLAHKNITFKRPERRWLSRGIKNRGLEILNENVGRKLFLYFNHQPLIYGGIIVAEDNEKLAVDLGNHAIAYLYKRDGNLYDIERMDVEVEKDGIDV